MVEEMLNTLKNPGIQVRFLENDGLEMLSRFIGKLPDGSWPLSSARVKILNMILTLPAEYEQLSKTTLGRTITNMSNNPHEFKEVKKIVAHIKEKWMRKLCN